MLSRASLVVALLALPGLAGFGWSGLLEWAPDLWLVLLVLVALLTATTVVRLALALPRLRRAQAPTRPLRPEALTVDVGERHGSTE